jgi:cytoskeletal protein CcmA (bactofilin family)
LAATAGVRASGITELPSFTGKKLEAGKPVHCLKCGRTHQVSQKAQSTICPGCYAPIELIEVNITAHSSRAVDTRGLLKIGAKGSLSNPWIICGSARIEGAFHGHLRCEGEVRLNMQKPCTGRITADSILVEKKASIECSQPLEADSITIQGTLRGAIHCNGIIQILSGGSLEGPVTSRAMVVEKGGIHVGECRIQPPSAPEPAIEAAPPEEISAAGEA